MADISSRLDRADGCIYIWAPRWRQPHLLADQFDEEVEYCLSTAEDRADAADFEAWSSLQVYVVTSDNLDLIIPILQNKNLKSLETTVVVPLGPLPAEQHHVTTELGKTLSTLGATVCADLSETAEFINDYCEIQCIRAEALAELGARVWDE